MTEHQHLEFQAIYRPLAQREMATLCGFSSRATRLRVCPRRGRSRSSLLPLQSVSNRRQIADEFRQLPIEEKLALLHDLWRELAAEAEARSLTDAERQFLDDRMRAIDGDSRPDRDWSAVRDDLLR